MVHTQEELEYIEYYMWRHGADMAVRDIAQELGTGTQIIYQLAQKYNIPVQVRNAKTKEMCNGRPRSCFTCKMIDCRFAGKPTEEETAYLYSGISIANDRNRERSKKRRVIKQT